MSLVGYVLFRHSEQKAAEKRRRRQYQAQLVTQLIRDLKASHRAKKEARRADEEARGRGFRNRYHENWVLIEAEAMNEEFDQASEAIDFSHVVEVATALLAGGETTADVAAYIAYQTGISQKEAKAILLGIKGELAVKAE